MRRTLCQWLIDRAVERNASVPAWVRRQIDGDEQLARFEAASRQLGARLRRDAPGWMALQSGDIRGELPRPTLVRLARPRAVGAGRGRRAWALAACAAAACALVAVGWWESRPRGDHRAAPTMSPTEQQQLIAFWRTGRANVNAWTARVKGAAGKFEVLELPQPLFPPVEVADATARRLHAALDAAVTSQREDVTSGMKSAYRFFAHRLPASVAIFVGLQDRADPPQVL